MEDEEIDEPVLVCLERRNLCGVLVWKECAQTTTTHSVVWGSVAWEGILSLE